MRADLESTLLQLFTAVQHDPGALPPVPLDQWPEESVERQLLSSFQAMAQGVRQRLQLLQEAERQLREREDQYRSIFEAVSDSLTISSLEDGGIVEANPAACQMLGYSYGELITLPPAVLVHPDSLPLAAEGLERFRTTGRNDVPLTVNVRKDGSSFLVESHSTQLTYRGTPHMLTVARDITERVEGERQLREREALYRGIFEVTHDGLSILDLDGYYVEVNPVFCHMYGYTRQELIGMHVKALVPPVFEPAASRALAAYQAGQSYQANGLGLRKDGTTFPTDAYGIPITYRGQSHVLEVIRDITEQVGAQQLLEQRVQERTRELSTLLEVSHNVTSTLKLDSLLGLILDQLKSAMDYTGASISIVEGNDLVLLDSRGPASQDQFRHLRIPLQRLGPIGEMITSRQPLFLPDVQDESPLAQTVQTAVGVLMDTMLYPVRACLMVPLILKDHVMGMLMLTSSEADAFSEHHATLALAIANQAAIAIENARLYEQAQALAALEERQKLARELHDSVSQALYSISLGAHTARTLLDRDPALVVEPLDYVVGLAKAGLAEMRALIFELRPESLETEGLVSALTKQGSALQFRHEVAVNLDLGLEPDLPLPVKQDLYRIAQEALHNTVKHAEAHMVSVSLSQTRDTVILEVRDDGVGFDPAGAFPGHLGLRSMQERVKQLGGVLSIESAPGHGTTISARVPARKAIQAS
jgi:PAS domain S-box-containing protein